LIWIIFGGCGLRYDWCMTAAVETTPLQGSEAGPRVLIVDDDALLRESLARALSDRGYETLTAADGEEASSLLGSGAVALVITDIYLGTGDGFALIKALRNRSQSLPIIAMSGDRLDVDVFGTARALGADATLLKPFFVSELNAVIERLLHLDQ
jgi:DNA-binding response OmpR family regulator